APGDKRLVAYVTRSEGADPTAEELRAHLGAVLPEYMVPSAFVVLERLPLTPNGKLDRRALPVPEVGAYASRQYEAPEGAIDVGLARLWSEVLKVPRVGRHDNFFELGGHSLLGMRLVIRMADELGIRPPVASVFQHPD